RLTARSDLGALLAGATGLRPDAGSALDRAKRYDGERLIAAEKAAEERRLARVAEHRRRFVDGPALRLPLTAAVSYSFDPNGIEAIDSERSVYERLHVSDEWGVLDATAGARGARR